MNSMTIIAQLNVCTAILVLLAMAIISAVLLRRTYRRLDTKSDNRSFLEKAPRFDPLQNGNGSPTATEKAHWEADICEIAREASARIDSKIRTLAELIRQADSAAERLEAANQEARQRQSDSQNEF